MVFFQITNRINYFVYIASVIVTMGLLISNDYCFLAINDANGYTRTR